MRHSSETNMTNATVSVRRSARLQASNQSTSQASTPPTNSLSKQKNK
ncbi:hypothetical protein BC937DRAFT_90544, partial [Endogone sp. FLAS-F59071]